MKNISIILLLLYFLFASIGPLVDKDLACVFRYQVSDYCKQKGWDK